MATLEKSDFDQCASCRDCTLESMRTQASFDLCAFFPISRFTDSTARAAPYLLLFAIDHVNWRNDQIIQIKPWAAETMGEDE
jgi:hypothetical protein